MQETLTTLIWNVDYKEKALVELSLALFVNRISSFMDVLCGVKDLFSSRSYSNHFRKTIVCFDSYIVHLLILSCWRGITNSKWPQNLARVSLESVSTQLGEKYITLLKNPCRLVLPWSTIARVAHRGGRHIVNGVSAVQSQVRSLDYSRQLMLGNSVTIQSTLSYSHYP